MGILPISSHDRSSDHVQAVSPPIAYRFDIDRITLEYLSKICRQMFPPGEHFKIPLTPDVESINARGDFAIEMDRLAIIDGDRDPWRGAVSFPVLVGRPS